MTQNNLGNALQTLGQRESGTERLLEAVNAYRDALSGIHTEHAAASALSHPVARARAAA